MAGGSERSKGQGFVAVVNGGVGLVVLILVAVLALVVNPPSPPGIAAFAPQANKPIVDAPNNQSSAFGDGAGQCAAGQDCEALDAITTTTTTKSKPRGVPSSLQCYTWPDGTVTQTFDPQSPPCVATWDDTKGNGGKTSPGVDASTIRVALPMNDTGPTWPALSALVDFFNTRYQFYGRKIQIVPFVSQQANANFTGEFNQPDMQRADASRITELNVFATTDFVDPIHYSWTLPVFLDVVARAKIISINGGEMTPYGSAAELNARAPYVWTFLPPIDTLMNAYGQMICRQLAGKPARHAPDPRLRDTTRKFAILLPVDADLGGPMPGLSTLQRILDGCDLRDLKIMRYTVAAGDTAANSASLSELSRDGVTSLVWFPLKGSAQPAHPMNVAASIGYQPEWVTIGWNNYLTASTLNAQGSGPAASFGVATWNKTFQLELEYWHRAFLAAGGDQAITNGGAIPDGKAFYNELLLLAAGIQMAGPNLTPETFAKGLRSTRFPNPGAGGPAIYQARVGFGPNDPMMLQDFVGFWLDTRMTGQEVTQSKNLDTSRAYCYVALGRRFPLTQIPATDAYYQGTCR